MTGTTRSHAVAGYPKGSGGEGIGCLMILPTLAGGADRFVGMRYDGKGFLGSLGDRSGWQGGRNREKIRNNVREGAGTGCL